MESAFDVCTEDLFNQVALLNSSNANFPAGVQYFTKLSFIFILCLKCLIRFFLIPNLTFKSKVSFLYFRFPANLSNLKIVRCVPSEWLCNTWKIVQNCAIFALRQWSLRRWRRRRAMPRGMSAPSGLRSLSFVVFFLDMITFFVENFLSVSTTWFECWIYNIWITAGEALDDQDCPELYVKVPPYPASGEQWEARRPPRKGETDF